MVCRKLNFKFLLSHLKPHIIASKLAENIFFEPNTIFSKCRGAIFALSIPPAVTKSVQEISNCSHLVVAKNQFFFSEFLPSLKLLFYSTCLFTVCQ